MFLFSSIIKPSFHHSSSSRDYSDSKNYTNTAILINQCYVDLLYSIHSLWHPPQQSTAGKILDVSHTRLAVEGCPQTEKSNIKIKESGYGTKDAELTIYNKQKNLDQLRDQYQAK